MSDLRSAESQSCPSTRPCRRGRVREALKHGANADGRHPRQLTVPRPNTSDIDEQVSPDGRWIVFERNRDNLPRRPLHLVRPDGTDDHALNVGCTGKCFEASTPTWLSNTRIAFQRVYGPIDKRGLAAAAPCAPRASTAPTSAAGPPAASTGSRRRTGCGGRRTAGT